jgi:hypothetical protein
MRAARLWAEEPMAWNLQFTDQLLHETRQKGRNGGFTPVTDQASGRRRVMKPSIERYSNQGRLDDIR